MKPIYYRVKHGYLSFQLHRGEGEMKEQELLLMISLKQLKHVSKMYNLL